MTSILPHVAIVGRANVGKSTLFNRVTRKRSAIVNDTPGVTRDRMYQRVDAYRAPFILIDTGGIDLDDENEIDAQVKVQAEFALLEADVILIVVDSQVGVTPHDIDVIQRVRKANTPLFLAVNKVDDPKHESETVEFSELGIERSFLISAEHGLGIEDLIEEVISVFQTIEVQDIGDEDLGVRLAIVGRPNVGKSSLINRLLCKERSIVSDRPGTTRDTTDTALLHDGEPYVLMDTAGIRRKGKTAQVLEKFSVIMALKALGRCDIALIVIDGEDGITEQDATIAGYVFEQGRACLLLINKWDLVQQKKVSFAELEIEVRDKLKFLEFAPLLALSAKSGYGVTKLFPQIQQVYQESKKKIPTAKLNICFKRAIEKNPMSSYRRHFLKFYYATQIKDAPPTFQCFVNYPEGIHFSYKRYLTNFLRQSFGFQGVPIRLIFTAHRNKKKPSKPKSS